MKLFAKNGIKYIVWHTAGHYSPRSKVEHDTSFEDLWQWHVNERGWDHIGYHFLIRKRGDRYPCRRVQFQGAHVRGINHASIGICFSGSGDHSSLTAEQLGQGLELTTQLMRDHNIPVQHVIGHREVNDLIDAGKVPPRFRTAKSCPGRYIDMDKVREDLSLLQKQMRCKWCRRCVCHAPDVNA